MTLRTFFNDVFAAIHVVALVAFVAMLFRRRFREAFTRRCVGTATAVDLAYVRIVVCTVLIAYVLSEDLPSQASFGPEWFDPPGYAKFLGKEFFTSLLASETRLRLLSWLLVSLLVLGLVGLATRVVLPLSFVVYFVFAALLRSFGKNFHEGYLALYALLAVCFGPSNDAWSLDARYLRPLWARFRKRQLAEVPAAAYNWFVYACYAAISLPYLQLAFSKLAYGGLFWFDGRGQRNYMLVDNLNLSYIEIDLALSVYHAPTLLFTGAAFVALASEFLYPLVLVVPRLRLVLPPAVLLLHLGILLFSDVRFVDAMLLPAIFLGPSRWRRRAA